MSNIINSEAYVKQGDKVYKVNGGAPIHTFNSVEEMNAANLADGTIACVPSSGSGGGLPVVELANEITENGQTLSAEDADLLEIVAAKGMPIIAKFNLESNAYNVPMTFIDMGGVPAFMCLVSYQASIAILLFTNMGGWMVNIMSYFGGE